jgi:two-component system sensor histidine kinase PilS (NtrC family)
MTFSPLRSGEGAPLGLIAVSEDLSAIRAMELRMRQADRLATLGRLSANIAHELRNPLASLTGAVEALTTELSTAEMRQRLTRIVLTEAGRLNQTITDFLEYARPMPVAARRVNVAEILEEVLAGLEQRVSPDHLKIVREIQPTLLCPVDPQQFRQAIWNLGLDAVEAMPEGGEVRVCALRMPGHLQIRLSDTGEAIPAEDLAHVFEPFSAARATGSGLGLALVHRIVRDHGGEIEASSAPGFGTTFTLTVPTHDA